MLPIPVIDAMGVEKPDGGGKLLNLDLPDVFRANMILGLFRIGFGNPGSGSDEMVSRLKDELRSLLLPSWLLLCVGLKTTRVVCRGCADGGGFGPAGCRPLRRHWR
ncbi:hypothetical protein U1Q18_038304 [Sarracenia purpurea var. burkii]